MYTQEPSFRAAASEVVSELSLDTLVLALFRFQISDSITAKVGTSMMAKVGASISSIFFCGVCSFEAKQFQIRLKREEPITALPGDLSEDLVLAHQSYQLIGRTIIHAANRRSLINAQDRLLEQLLQ